MEKEYRIKEFAGQFIIEVKKIEEYWHFPFPFIPLFSKIIKKDRWYTADVMGNSTGGIFAPCKTYHSFYRANEQVNDWKKGSIYHKVIINQ